MLEVVCPNAPQCIAACWKTSASSGHQAKRLVPLLGHPTSPAGTNGGLLCTLVLEEAQAAGEEYDGTLRIRLAALRGHGVGHGRPVRHVRGAMQPLHTHTIRTDQVEVTGGTSDMMAGTIMVVPSGTEFRCPLPDTIQPSFTFEVLWRF